MLTEEENRFIEYWSVERTRKKQFLRKLSIGLPFGVLVVVSTLISIMSGWYKKADMTVRSGGGSVIIVVIIAGLAIVVFMTIFGARHKWDQNELHYHELLARKKSQGKQQPDSNEGLKT